MTDLAVRTAYDAVAVSYADLFRSALAASPFDRAVLGIFAELVSGRMAHVGCGPGRITGHLHQLGADVFGVDLSPQMVAVARTDHPRLRLDVGTITELHLEQGYGHDISLDVYRMDPARVTA